MTASVRSGLQTEQHCYYVAFSGPLAQLAIVFQALPAFSSLSGELLLYSVQILVGHWHWHWHWHWHEL
jgi:hypothetical protein